VVLDAAAQRRGGVRVRGGAVAGDAGELLGAGGVRAGHEGWGRMQALLRTYAWSWKDLRAELPALAAGWLPDDEGDLIGPGIAIDETAHLKHGDDTACVASPARRVHRQGGKLRHHRVHRLRHRTRGGLGGLRRVHAGPVGG